MTYKPMSVLLYIIFFINLNVSLRTETRSKIQWQQLVSRLTKTNKLHLPPIPLGANKAVKQFPPAVNNETENWPAKKRFLLSRTPRASLAGKPVPRNRFATLELRWIRQSKAVIGHHQSLHRAQHALMSYLDSVTAPESRPDDWMPHVNPKSGFNDARLFYRTMLGCPIVDISFSVRRGREYSRRDNYFTWFCGLITFSILFSSRMSDKFSFSTMIFLKYFGRL